MRKGSDPASRRALIVLGLVIAMGPSPYASAVPPGGEATSGPLEDSVIRNEIQLPETGSNPGGHNGAPRIVKVPRSVATTCSIFGPIPKDGPLWVLSHEYAVYPDGRVEDRGLACDPYVEPQHGDDAAETDGLARRIVELLRLPEPLIGVAPADAGITGIETYLWAAGFGAPEGQGRCEAAPGAPAAAVCVLDTRLDGRQVYAEARPVRYVWRTGDDGTRAPQSLYVTEKSGGRHDPAVAHLYEEKSTRVKRDEGGVYMLSMEVVWQARYRVDGGEWKPLKERRTSSSRPYRVDEVVARLVG